MRGSYGVAYGVILLVVMSLPLTAVAETPSFDPDQPFRQAFTSNMLRAMLNKTLDLIENHIEVAGDVGQEDAAGEREGRFSIKVYPQGKSESDEHLAAEGSFRLSPDLGRQDFHLRLERPQQHSGRASSRPDGVL